MPSRFTSQVLVLLAAAQMSACCGDDVRVMIMGGQGEIALGPIWVGDTMPSTTFVTRPPEAPCYELLYDSRQYPERFTYRSRDTTRATFDSHGVVVARDSGTVWMVVSTPDGRDSVPLHVALPTVRFEQSMEPGAPRVGDTITFHVAAIAPDGARFSDSLSHSHRVSPAVVLSKVNAPFRGVDAETWRYVAKEAGSYRFTSFALRTTARGTGSRTDILPFTVLPRP
jgi:hypothetical protein